MLQRMSVRGSYNSAATETPQEKQETDVPYFCMGAPWSMINSKRFQSGCQSGRQVTPNPLRVWSGARLRVWSGARLRVWSGARLRVWSGARLRVWSGARLRVWSGARLRVWSGARLRVWSGARLRVWSGARLRVWSGAGLRVWSGARLRANSFSAGDCTYSQWSKCRSSGRSFLGDLP